MSHGKLAEAIVGVCECSKSTAKRAIDDATIRGVILRGGGLYALPKS
jgi:hypothetical protein